MTSIDYPIFARHPDFDDSDKYKRGDSESQSGLTTYRTCDVPLEIVEGFREVLAGLELRVEFTGDLNALTIEARGAQVRQALDAKLEEINKAQFDSDDEVEVYLDGTTRVSVEKSRFRGCSNNSTVVQEDPRLCESTPGAWTIHLFLDCHTDEERMVQAKTGSEGIRAKGIEAFVVFDD